MRKITAIILVLVVCFCSICVYADTNEKFTIRVDSKEVKVGETIELNINMENNTGILAMLFVLNYDSTCLKLIDVKNGTIVEGAIFGNDYSQIPYKMLWNSASDTNFTDNGVLATLVFEVSANASDGVTDVTLTYKEKNVYDVDLNPVDISVENGTITIVDEENSTDNNENTSDKENNNEESSSTDKPNYSGSSGTSSGSSVRPNKKEDKNHSSSIVSLPDKPQISTEEDYEVELLHFVDVKENDWYYEAVKFAFEKGITSGVSETSYAPNDKVTRGQFITMLCRAYGIKEMTGDNFADCGDTWYTGYLAAAKQLGISNGVGDNKFAPEKEITREEMVTLIYNYLKSVDKVDEEINETTFTDDDTISDWAKNGVAFASSKGYVNGKGNNIFDPSGDATRAELAQIFFNILK